MKTALSADAAAALIPDGSVCLIGGFMGVGSPHRLIDAMVRRGVKNLTVIANDTAMPGKGIGKLITAGAVRKVIASHIGLNPETQKKMISGELEVELVPQGTLVERIRAGGVGLGGVLTATGLGTLVEKGAQRRPIPGHRGFDSTRGPPARRLNRIFQISGSFRRQSLCDVRRSADQQGGDPS